MACRSSASASTTSKRSRGWCCSARCVLMSTTNGAEAWRMSVSVGRSAALAQLESGHMDYMCQVSSSELGLIDPCLDLCVDFVECALERGIDGAEVWKRGGEAWAQEAVETGLTRARHEPAIGATKSTRLVGLRRSLARTCHPVRS